MREVSKSYHVDELENTSAQSDPQRRAGLDAWCTMFTLMVVDDDLFPVIRVSLADLKLDTVTASPADWERLLRQ